MSADCQVNGGNSHYQATGKNQPLFIQSQQIKKLSHAYIFCGSRGWTVPEPDKKQSEEDKRIYDRELIRLEMSIQSALKQVEEGDEIILIMHYPPFNSALEESDFTRLIEKYNIKTVVMHN